jgi:hypothetical protein
MDKIPSLPSLDYRLGNPFRGFKISRGNSF